MAVDARVDDRCWKWDDFGGGLSHLESRVGGFCVCFDAAQLWQSKAFALLLGILVAFDAASLQLWNWLEFFDKLEDDAGVWFEPESCRNAIHGGSKKAC